MKTVLIVDDAAFMRNILKMMLERNNYKVTGEAENGKVAVSMYQSLKPDFVTMDITMPEMDGITAVKLIKQIDSNAKVVMVTAMGQEAMIVDAVTAGAKGFIAKPFSEEYVIKTLSSL